MKILGLHVISAIQAGSWEIWEDLGKSHSYTRITRKLASLTCKSSKPRKRNMITEESPFQEVPSKIWWLCSAKAV